MNTVDPLGRLPAMLFTAANLLFLLAFAGAAVSAEKAEFRLDAPLEVRALEVPRDDHKRDRFAELQKLSRAVNGGIQESATEGAASHVLFGHPLRMGISNSRPGFYTISNFVDQDPAAPDMLLDYNCGMRTYDLDDGYNHQGIDYSSFPYAWLGMAQDASIAVAAADGMILAKNDGAFDMNCSLGQSGAANEVLLEHSDGSFSIYTHLKQGSVTSLGAGDMVQQGDYLGVVGSSGFATGPHLHFEVYDSLGDLIDPNTGSCNAMNPDTWWHNQEPYYVPSVNSVSTHSAEPVTPPCPGVEQPNLKDVFSSGDELFFTVYIRDALSSETVTIELRDPGNLLLFSAPVSQEPEHLTAAAVEGSLNIPGNAIPGAYTLRVSYAGQTRDHTFYINAGPPPTPTAQVSNNAQNGLFFDADLDGEGYNFVTTPAGTIIYFYGSDADGNRLWLISDLIRGDFGPGATIEVTMFESSGGTFAAPVASTRGLSIWGALILEFSDCDSATAVLVGEDGEKVSQLVKLAGASGTACVGGAVRADAPWTGLWYDPSDDGEGYNVIVAPNGVILYYYGFASNGRRLWLISDLITAELQVGVAVEIEVYEATQGTFDNPAPSSQLVQWGTATITLHDCGDVTIVLEGDDGNKTSSTVRLASVIGLNCSD